MVYCHSAPPQIPNLPLTPVNLSYQASTHHHTRSRQHVARSLHSDAAATHHRTHKYAPIPIVIPPLDSPKDAIRNPATPRPDPTNHAPRQHNHNPAHISHTPTFPIAIALPISTPSLPNARHNRSSRTTPMDALQHTPHIFIRAHLYLDTANTMAHRSLSRRCAAITRNTEQSG